MGIFSRKLSLSVKERLLLQILKYQKHESEFELPVELTQAGIAKSTGIARPNVSRAMKILQENDQVEGRLSHIKGHKRQKKIYLLTHTGHVLATELDDSLGRARLKFKNRNGITEELTINEIIERMPGELGKLELINNLNDEGDCDFSHLATLGKSSEEIAGGRDSKPKPDIAEKASSKGFIHVMNPPLVSRDFYGRGGEISRLNKWLLAPETRCVFVHGIPGIGKTTLALEIQNRRRDRASILWYGFKEWESVNNLLGVISSFLEQLGRKKLKSLLESSRPPDTVQTADILAEELAGLPVLIVFDDFHHASNEIITLFRSLMPMLTHQYNLKIIMLSRKLVKFYDRRDVVLNKSVMEMALSGLDEASSRKLLSIADISDEEFTNIYLRTGGHPLYLELMNSAPDNAGGAVEERDMFEFMHEEIFSKIAGAEQKLLKMASVYRYPVYAEAFFTDPEISYSHIDDLVARSYLLRHGLNLFDTHDLIRTFFYNRLTKVEREKYHKAAAEFYMQLFSNLNTENIVDIDSAVLAEALLEIQHHLIRSGEQAEALSYTLAYGKKLIDAGKFELLVILDEYYLEGLDSSDEARILLQKGEILTHLGDYDEALRILDAGLEKLEESDGGREHAFILIMIGENHAAREDWVEASNNYMSALESLESIPESKRVKDDIFALARCYNNLGLVLKKLGKAEEALELYMTGLEILEENELGNVVDRAAVMENLGLLFIELNRPEYAHDYFNKAISELEESRDFGALAKLLATVGEVYVELGDIRTATEFFERGVYFWEQAEDTEHATDTFLRLGQVFAQQVAGTSSHTAKGAHQSYWERFQRFFSQSEHEDFKKISHLYDRIGSLYMHRGYWHKSLEFHNKALELFKKLNDDRGLAKVYNNLGVLHRSRNEPVQALESYKKALVFLDAQGEKRGQAITNLNIGRLYERLEKPEESKKAYEDCILVVSNEDSMIRYAGLALLGLARQAQAGTTVRERYLTKAEEIFRKLNDNQNLAEVVRLKVEK